MAKATPADPIERLCTRIEQLSEAIRRVLRRCNDNGGEIDAELVRELKAAIGGGAGQRLPRAAIPT